MTSTRAPRLAIALARAEPASPPPTTMRSYGIEDPPVGTRDRAWSDRSVAHRGLDVVVEAEEVGRVVGGLERGQARVVRPVRGPNAVVPLVAEVVGVDAALQERLHRREELARPGDVARRVRRLRPLRENVEVVL